MQAVEKIFPDYFSNNEESSQAKVYKKLWIDAEAALCSLKYELQLAQIKLKAENHNHQSKGIAIIYSTFYNPIIPHPIVVRSYAKLVFTGQLLQSSEVSKSKLRA